MALTGAAETSGAAEDIVAVVRADPARRGGEVRVACFLAGAGRFFVGRVWLDRCGRGERFACFERFDGFGAFDRDGAIELRR